MSVILGRRQLLRALGAGALMGGASRVLRPRAAHASAGDRKFLFLFCRGGWDTSRVFVDHSGVPNASYDPDAVPSEIGDLQFMDSAERPNVRAWLDAHAPRTCFINGLEVASVAHERCRRLVLTSDAGNDWPSLIAAGSPSALTLPYLVLAGPSYTSTLSSLVVRVGDDGQLPKLLTGEAQANATRPVAALPSAVESLADAAVRAQLGLQAADLASPRALGASAYASSLDAVATLFATEDLSLTPRLGPCARDIVADAESAIRCFELGLSRCAMLQYNGQCDASWDSHTSLDIQNIHYEELFLGLTGIVDAISARGLEDEVTLVVFSEMGRHPLQNTIGGKDHWTFTSMFLHGAGVRGGQSLGGIDESAIGLPLDLVSGQHSADGVVLRPGHIGATLLTLAGLDPAALGVTSGALTAAIT